MGKSFMGSKIKKSLKSLLLFCVVLVWLADFVAVSPYSSRQLPNQVPHGYKTKFWAYTPLNYSKQGPAFPLLISLHGGSAIGDDLNMLFERTHENPPQLIHIDRWFDLPFVVVSPQLKRDPSVPHYNEQNWPPDLVDELVEYVKKQYNVDPARIYVTGISLGAAGVWRYAAAYPEKVAAILPMGGQSPKADACKLKDIPIWVFHGENDVFVPVRFTREMAEAVNACEPRGQYRPFVKFATSVQHEVWDQVYNMTGGYDVYRWFLTFKKGDTTNKAPFVFAGLPRKMKIPDDALYLTAEYFDSDGVVDSVKWRQVDNGSDQLKLENINTKFLKVTGATEPGIYLFEVAVKDDKGLRSADTVSVMLQENEDDHAVLKLYLTDQYGKHIYGELGNDQKWDLHKLGTKINVVAKIKGFNYKIRWSVNSDQNARETNQWHVRFWKDYSPLFLRATDDGLIKSGWTITEGEYVICATVLENELDGDGKEGTSLCYKVNFTCD